MATVSKRRPDPVKDMKKVNPEKEGVVSFNR
jgi:hypothetical protein